MAYCLGKYTTNLPLDLVMEEGFLAHRQNGAELGKNHGWPLRLVGSQSLRLEERQVG